MSSFRAEQRTGRHVVDLERRLLVAPDVEQAAVDAERNPPRTTDRDAPHWVLGRRQVPHRRGATEVPDPPVAHLAEIGGETASVGAVVQVEGVDISGRPPAELDRLRFERGGVQETHRDRVEDDVVRAAGAERVGGHCELLAVGPVSGDLYRSVERVDDVERVGVVHRGRRPVTCDQDLAVRPHLDEAIPRVRGTAGVVVVRADEGGTPCQGGEQAGPRLARVLQADAFHSQKQRLLHGVGVAGERGRQARVGGHGGILCSVGLADGQECSEHRGAPAALRRLRPARAAGEWCGVLALPRRRRDASRRRGSPVRSR